MVADVFEPRMLQSTSHNSGVDFLEDILIILGLIVVAELRVEVLFINEFLIVDLLQEPLNLRDVSRGGTTDLQKVKVLPLQKAVKVMELSILILDIHDEHLRDLLDAF